MEQPDELIRVKMLDQDEDGGHYQCLAEGCLWKGWYSRGAPSKHVKDQHGGQCLIVDRNGETLRPGRKRKRSAEEMSMVSSSRSRRRSHDDERALYDVVCRPKMSHVHQRLLWV